MIENKGAIALPIDKTCSLPSPVPLWQSDDHEFGGGLIDIGGLELRPVSVSSLYKVWAAQQGGPDDLGASFFRPTTPLPSGFFILGHYAHPNNNPLSPSAHHLLIARDLSSSDAAVSPILKPPLDFTLLWTSSGSDVKQTGTAYFWLPSPPDGYKAAGFVVTDTSGKPSTDEFRCVRDDFIDECEPDTTVWHSDKDGVTMSPLRPSVRGVQALGIPVGTFLVQANGSAAAAAMSSLGCLKNNSPNLGTSMPTQAQIEALMQNYCPWIYLHPNESYRPSSVNWFFKNGAQLYQRDNQTSPMQIQPDGSNLPQDGSDDGSFWIDLPTDGSQREMVKKGDIDSLEAYMHVKPMLGATCTDIAIWLFYPFNGPARAKVTSLLTVSLGKIGEHVGDWEHVTLRFSNFTGELQSMYFSEHGGGTWVDASQLELEEGNRPVTYSSLNGHAFYSKLGLVLQGGYARLGIGIRNDTAKGTRIDVKGRLKLVSADYLNVVEPGWMNYRRRWGPTERYDVGKEIAKVVRWLPKKVRERVEETIEKLPEEVLGEKGPTGPKFKSSWFNDEQ